MKNIGKRRQLNPDKLKILISSIIALIFGVFVFLAYSILMNRFSDATVARFAKYDKQIVDGYSSAILKSIENYKTGLETFYYRDIISYASSEEIQDFLIQYIPKNHKDFHDVFYVDKSGHAYSQNGKIYNVMERDYYNAILIEGKEEFLSLPILSRVNNHAVVVIAIAVKDSEDKTKGALCASIEIDHFQKITANLSSDESSYFVIIDENGRFISHPDKAWLFKTYTPEDPRFKHLSSIYMAQTKDGNFASINTKNQNVMVCFRPIPSTNWTLARLEYFEDVIAQRKIMKYYKIFIIFIGIAAMILLVFCEFIILDKFQKKQMLKTDYDSLTQLWNRQRFEQEASKIIKKTQKPKLMLIEADVRGFKFINENYGEEAADNLLIFISQIINKFVSQYKGITSRGFGDHFYALIKISSVHTAMGIFKNILNELNDEIKSYEIPFVLKFGISFYMPHSDEHKNTTIQSLIGQASFAKSTIKDNMIDSYAIYNSKLLQKINEEQFIESHMEQALENHEFFVMYQPKIDLHSERIVGAEALVRWNNPKMGILSPATFIPLFEKNGFITKLDFYVYEEVFRFLEEQVKKGENLVPISVNMSRNHNKADKFMHNFLKMFKKYQITPDLIQLEILERSVMDNTTLKDITNSLHKEGFSVAIDDFGSGESSLNMLTKIPVDVLKFDREFLSSSTNEKGELDKKSAGFIEILVNLSKHLQKQIVFEGVETKAQSDFLKSIDCDQAQGFFYSRPLTKEDFIAFKKNHI